MAVGAAVRTGCYPALRQRAERYARHEAAYRAELEHQAERSATREAGLRAKLAETEAKVAEWHAEAKAQQARAENVEDHLRAVLDSSSWRLTGPVRGIAARHPKAVARAIRSELRATDLLCRLGGDEFLVLCPATDGDGALAVAERIRLRVRDCAERLVPEIPVTTSLGIATFPGDAAVPDDLMRAADDALYAAKALGRDVAARYVTPPPELVAS